MNSKSKYLSKNIILFALSSFGPKLIAFILVPLYTTCLSTYEYGVGDIITTTASLVLPVITFSIESAILRFCFDENTTAKEVCTCGFTIFFKGISVAILITIVIILAPCFKLSTVYVISCLLILVANGLYNVLTNTARGIDKVNVMVEMSLITTGASCLLNIFFLLILGIGLEGFLMANYLGTFLSVLWGSFRLNILKYYDRSVYQKGLAKRMKRYGFPLALNSIGWWVNSSSDRYIVSVLLGVSANGVYSVAYKIPTILVACSDVFAQAWQLSAIKDFDPEDNDRFISNSYSVYNAFLVICSSLLTICSIPLAYILYANDFFVAWRYVPPLIYSFAFGGLAGFFGSIFMAVKDTRIFTYSTIIGAVVNISLNLILVNPFGIMGAAIATLVSNVAIWCVRLQRVKKHIHLHVPWLKHFVMYLLLLIQFMFCMKATVTYAVICQIGCLLLLSVLNFGELKTVVRKAIGLFFKKKV